MLAPIVFFITIIIVIVRVSRYHGGSDRFCNVFGWWVGVSVIRVMLNINGVLYRKGLDLS